MHLETGKNFEVEEVRKALVCNLEKRYSMDKYLSYVGYLGREVLLSFGGERVPATLLSVDDEGKLVVEIEGKRRIFSSAEVSLRI